MPKKKSKETQNLKDPTPIKDIIKDKKVTKVEPKPEPKKRGRKSKYVKKFCDDIIDFFCEPPYEDIELPHFKNGEVSWIDKKRMPRQLPTIESFARHKEIHISTIYDWIDDESPRFKKEFSEAFMRAKKMQKEYIIQNGLQGLYNPIFAKFVAINITDMQDKKVTENTGPDGGPIQVANVLTPEQEKSIRDFVSGVLMEATK